MGLVIDVSQTVSVELRRESFVLVVGTDAKHERLEVHFKDLDGVQDALTTVSDNERYFRWMRKEAQ
jgi:hypothetical protein